MALIELLLGFLGLACLARGSHRFRALAIAGHAAPAAAKPVGWALLAAAALIAVLTWGGAQGIVTLLCASGVAGVALVLLLSVHPTLALTPTVPLLAAFRPATAGHAPHRNN